MHEVDIDAEAIHVEENAARAGEEIAKIAPAFDSSVNPQEAIEIAWRRGVYRFSIPTKFGGLSTGDPTFRLESLLTSLLSICAGDGSVGMMVVTTTVRLRLLFAPSSGLGDAALRAIANAVLTGDTANRGY